jgi:hypothetical protein
MPIRKRKKVYTEEEIQEYIETQIRLLKQFDEMDGANRVTSENIEEWRKLYYKLYKVINEVYGKDEDVLKAWQERVRQYDEEYKRWKEAKSAGTCHSA